jgi:hypothetical protein
MRRRKKPLFLFIEAQYQGRQVSGMYLPVRGIDFALFYDFAIGYLKLFRLCGIIVTVPTL